MAFFAATVPITAPAPGRLSTITCCPQFSLIFWATMRARISVEVPGVNCAMMRIGRVGYSGGAATSAAGSDSPMQKAEGRIPKCRRLLSILRSFFILPPSAFLLAFALIMPLRESGAREVRSYNRTAPRGARMPERELWRLPAVELSELIGRKAVSPVELLDVFLERCARLNPILNAIVAMDADAARSDAVRAERRMQEGTRLGPLDGIPVTIKDNLFVQGLPATWGSLLYRDFRPPNDDIAVARLRAAGGIILGKTNTPEFALSSFTDNRLFGPTRNPWNPELTPGGSSGGAVASVAAGMAPLALGTDAGGSIRRPASYAGIVGLRPSTGRVARLHGFPPMAHDFQAITPAARSVPDCELLYRSIAGPDPRDRLSLAFGDLHQQEGVTLPRLRIRHVTGISGAPLDQEIASALKGAAAVFRELGHTIE